jgi:hypothetical protein
VPEQENRAVFSGLMDCFCFVGKQSLKEMFFAGTSKKRLIPEFWNHGIFVPVFTI